MSEEIYSIGDVVYIFNIDQLFITEGVIIEFNPDKTVNLIIKQSTNVLLKNVDVSYIFPTFNKCLDFATSIMENKIFQNSLTRLSTQKPHVMRFGKYDPLNKLVEEHLSGKKDLIGIQIGSYQGESTEIFINSGAFKTLYCIDPWEVGYDQLDVASDKRLPLAEQIFDKKFKNNKNIKKVKMKSSDAVDLFKDESIDFVYIDGNHQFQFVREDIKNYAPKVKKGGIVAGHDFNGPAVKAAAEEYFEKEPLIVYKDFSWLYIKE